MRETLLVLSIVLAVAGCVRPHAVTPARPSPLDVPLPPARVIVPPEPESPPAEAPAEEPETVGPRPARPRPGPARARPEAARPAESKPDTSTDASRSHVAAPAVQGQLQPVLPASPGAMERQVSEQLAQARRDLDRVDYRALGADARSQYDTAKRFIEQAGQALKDKNLVFAARLAEKALGLASNLAAR